MKYLKTSLLLLAILSVFIVKSCTDSYAGTPKNETGTDATAKVKNSTVSTVDTISLSKFTTWTNNWELYGQQYTQTTLVDAYTTPLVDLTEILGEAPTQVRYYIGLDITTTPYEPHIILVGVAADGSDMLDYSREQYAYDVSCPCPPACSQICEQ